MKSPNLPTQQRTILILDKINALRSCGKGKMEECIKLWQEIRELPPKFEKQAEASLIKEMIALNFSFQEAHWLFNEGRSNGLGERAMWLGAYLAFNALDEDFRKKQIVRQMIDDLKDILTY